MNTDLKCENCNAEFCVEVIEDSEEADTPQFCPFCGSEDIHDADEDVDDDAFDDDDVDDLEEEDLDYDADEE